MAKKKKKKNNKKLKNNVGGKADVHLNNNGVTFKIKINY